MSQRFGHTDREVAVNEGLGLANKWAACQSRDELLNHSAAVRFQDHLNHAARVVEPNFALVRGRGIEGSPPSSLRMGPPPQDATTEGGRYDHLGQKVLYLSSSDDGAHREMNRWRVSGTPYLQQYRLPTDALRIADFTNLPSDHFVTAVFSIAEEFQVDGRRDGSYLFSQVVAELVATRFDGMQVPGVRGEPNAHYTNVVVFSPHPNWPNWLESETTPYPLAPGSHPDFSFDEIVIVAYYIWINEGRPHGRHIPHWFAAIDQLRRRREGN